MRASAGRRRIVFHMFLALAAAPSASADDEWAPTTSGPMASLTAPLTPPQHLTLQPITLTTITRGTHDGSGTLVSGPSEASLSGQLFAELGVAEWFATGVQLQSLTTPTRAFALADTLAFTRIAWHEAGDPRHPAATWILQLTLPTGDVEAGTGDGAWVGTTGTSFTLYRRPFVVHADVLFSLPLPDSAGRSLRPSMNWTLAVEVPAAFVGNRAALLLEVAARHQSSTDLDRLLYPDAGAAEHEVLIGAALELIATDEMQALVGWQRTLYGRNVDAMDVVVVTLVPLLSPRSR